MLDQPVNRSYVLGTLAWIAVFVALAELANLFAAMLTATFCITAGLLQAYAGFAPAVLVWIMPVMFGGWGGFYASGRYQ